MHRNMRLLHFSEWEMMESWSQRWNMHTALIISWIKDLYFSHLMKSLVTGKRVMLHGYRSIESHDRGQSFEEDENWYEQIRKNRSKKFEQNQTKTMLQTCIRA